MTAPIFHRSHGQQQRRLLLVGLIALIITVGLVVTFAGSGSGGDAGSSAGVVPVTPTATPALSQSTPVPPTATRPPQIVPGGVLATLQPDRGIPDDPTAVVSVPVPQPTIVSRAAWGAADPVAPFIPQQPRQLTLHHEGVLFDGTVPAPQYLRQVQHWSMHNRQWPDIPYHFIIDLEGTIYEGRPPMAQGDSNTDYDLRGHVHIALLGKYDAGEQEPNPAQIAATMAVMAWLADQYALTPDTIHGHRDFIPLNMHGEHIDPRTGTRITCPGDNLYRYLENGTIPQGVAARLAGDRLSPQPAPTVPLEVQYGNRK